MQQYETKLKEAFPDIKISSFNSEKYYYLVDGDDFMASWYNDNKAIYIEREPFVDTPEANKLLEDFMKVYFNKYSSGIN